MGSCNGSASSFTIFRKGKITWKRKERDNRDCEREERASEIVRGRREVSEIVRGRRKGRGKLYMYIRQINYIYIYVIYILKIFTERF